MAMTYLDSKDKSFVTVKAMGKLDSLSEKHVDSLA
jgi:hypothetical protein